MLFDKGNTSTFHILNGQDWHHHLHAASKLTAKASDTWRNNKPEHILKMKKKKKGGHRPDLDSALLSCKEPSCCSDSISQTPSAVRRAFPHSESPPRGPSGAYHLGKHFLSIIRLAREWRACLCYGDTVAKETGVFSDEQHSKLFRTSLTFFLYDLESLSAVETCLQVEIWKRLRCILDGGGNLRKGGMRQKFVLRPMKTYLKIHTSYRG